MRSSLLWSRPTKRIRLWTDRHLSLISRTSKRHLRSRLNATEHQHLRTCLKKTPNGNQSWSFKRWRPTSKFYSRAKSIWKFIMRTLWLNDPPFSNKFSSSRHHSKHAREVSHHLRKSKFQHRDTGDTNNLTIHHHALIRLLRMMHSLSKMIYKESLCRPSLSSAFQT